MLKNISIIEYGKAVIESVTILKSWEKQLAKEAQVNFIQKSLSFQGVLADERDIKRVIDNIHNKAPQIIKNLYNGLELSGLISQTAQISEEDLKQLSIELSKKSVEDTGTGSYRNVDIEGKIAPDEILAHLVELFDWYGSLDSRETHPILRSGILKAQLEIISPFEENNFSVSNYAALISNQLSGYGFNGYVCLQNYFSRYKAEYEGIFARQGEQQESEVDLTEWLEYYCEAFANEVSNLKESVLLLARDTKVAKASGNANLSPRQEKIVEYLQDYGMLQNKTFPTIFPNISEDTVLREIKDLIEKGIVVKKGKTKSSRYELR